MGTVIALLEGNMQTFLVPADTVDAAWPGTAKTLKAHLAAVISAAEAG